jgi:cell division transport system ATP-binding protein
MISARHLAKRYDDRFALDDVTFDIAQGELAFLVGASGSGKTTLLRSIHAAIRPDGGALRVAGIDVRSIKERDLPRYRRLVSIAPQDHRLLRDRTVAENLRFTLGALGWRDRPARRRVDDLLTLIRLPEHGERYPHQLSGGERQRVVIARAIAGGPKVLLCDEPTGNLDPGTSAGIVRLLESVAELGTTVVMSTHDAGIVDSARRRVIELSGGRLVRSELFAGYEPTIAERLRTQVLVSERLAAELPTNPASTPPTVGRSDSLGANDIHLDRPTSPLLFSIQSGEHAAPAVQHDAHMTSDRSHFGTWDDDERSDWMPMDHDDPGHIDIDPQSGTLQLPSIFHRPESARMRLRRRLDGPNQSSANRTHELDNDAEDRIAEAARRLDGVA